MNLHKFLLVNNPNGGFWYELRFLIASFIFPEFKGRRENWYDHYFTHKYMKYVHEQYHKELSALNRALVRKQKQIKLLEKLSSGTESTHRITGEDEG
jgi:hypothetical protein